MQNIQLPSIKTLRPGASDYPEALRYLTDPPAKLFVQTLDLQELLLRPRVAIVGSRKVSTYGQAVTRQLASELARAGVVIVSGLALGIDAIAHTAALDAGGLTLAVLPTSIESIYPVSHTNLAQRIVTNGGALLSEYEHSDRVYKTNFIARNRIVAALADILLVTEAAEKSGTLHTARFALEQGKEVMTVPGNITSITSVGTNNLIKSGAAPVTEVADIFHALGIQPAAAERTKKPSSGNPQEQCILDFIYNGMHDGAALLQASNLPVQLFNQTLTMLEIKGTVRALGNNQWGLF